MAWSSLCSNSRAQLKVGIASSGEEDFDPDEALRAPCPPPQLVDPADVDWQNACSRHGGDGAHVAAGDLFHGREDQLVAALEVAERRALRDTGRRLVISRTVAPGLPSSTSSSIVAETSAAIVSAERWA